MVQWIERLASDQEIVGSSPTGRTLFIMKHKNGKMKLMKRIFLASFLFLFVFSLIPSQAQADLLPLVQCGGYEQEACDFCDFFEMINRIIKFVMFNLVPPIAILMLIVGGVMFFFGGAKPDMLIRAKGVITSVLIGLIIIFCAWVIVNTILTQIGIVQAPSLLQWYDIGCQ